MNSSGLSQLPQTSGFVDGWKGSVPHLQILGIMIQTPMKLLPMVNILQLLSMSKQVTGSSNCAFDSSHTGDKLNIYIDGSVSPNVAVNVEGWRVVTIPVTSGNHSIVLEYSRM